MHRTHLNFKCMWIGPLVGMIFYATFSFAQVATINITNVNSAVMNNTQLLFGITFDGRTSLIGNSTYGQIGYFDSSGAVIPAVDSIFGDFPLSTIRYPGNAIAVGFDWKKSIDTIGMIGQRPVQNILGAIGPPQPVNFGFDEFMKWTASKGVQASEIQIMVPIYDINSAGLTQTQLRAAVPNVIANNADWVEYCNAPNDGSNPGGGKDWAAERAANGHPLPYGIKIWNIGNEPWSNFEFGSSDSNCIAYLALVTPIIDSMLSRDSTIKITMPTTGNASTSSSWAYALLNSNLVASGKVYALSQHYFASENTIGSNPPTQGVSAVNAGLNSLINKAAAKSVKVFVGDYAHHINSASTPTQAQQDSAMQWLGANMEADFLLMLSQKSTIERANFWAYGNAYAIWHPIRINSIGNYTLMPAASIYKLLFPAFLDRSVQVTSTSPLASDGNPYSVRSNAFVSNDMNKLNIVAVNRDKNDTVPLQLGGVTGYSLKKSRLLMANSPIAETIIETVANTDTFGNYILPPMSVLILEHDKTIIGFSGAVKPNQHVFFYPNPAHEIINIILDDPLTEFILTDMQGKVISLPVQRDESKKSILLNIGFLNNGFYMLIVKSASGTSYQKLIVSHTD